MGPKSVVVGLVWNLANIFGGSREDRRRAVWSAGSSSRRAYLAANLRWKCVPHDKQLSSGPAQCHSVYVPCCPRVVWGGRWAVALLRWGTLNSGAKAINLWQIFKRNGRTACGFAFALKSLSLALPPPLAVPSCPCETWRHLTPRIILIIYLVIKKSKQEEAAASRFGHFACFWTFSAQFSLVVVVAVLLMLKIVKFNKLPAIFIAPGPGTSIDCECFCFAFFRFVVFFFWLSNLFMTTANIFQFLLSLWP